MLRLFACVLPLVVAGCGARSQLEQGEVHPTIALAAAASLACALVGDDEIRCWTTDDPEPRALPGSWDAIDLAIGGTDIAPGDVCAVLRNGRVRCIDRESGETAEVSGVEGATRISMGESFACALLASGRVACWGWGGYGALGDGTLVSRDEAREVPGLSDIVEVSAGDFSVCALRGDGHVLCWGRDYAGQLGDGATHVPCESETCSPVPVEVAGILDAIAISDGLNYACAVHHDRSVSCWGWNYSGQLGVGSPDDRSMPTRVALEEDVEFVRSGYTRGCMVLREGRRVVCAGSDPSALTTDPRNHFVPVRVPDLDGALELVGGWYFTCALTSPSDVVCTSDEGPIAIALE